MFVLVMNLSPLKLSIINIEIDRLKLRGSLFCQEVHIRLFSCPIVEDQESLLISSRVEMVLSIVTHEFGSPENIY